VLLVAQEQQTMVAMAVTGFRQALQVVLLLVAVAVAVAVQAPLVVVELVVAVLAHLVVPQTQQQAQQTQVAVVAVNGLQRPQKQAVRCSHSSLSRYTHHHNRRRTHRHRIICIRWIQTSNNNRWHRQCVVGIE
jgi:hypothetical protein